MNKKPLKHLIVCAYANEIKHLCAMERKQFIEKNDIGYLTAGIGPVAASFGLTHCLKNYKPEQIIAIGTAGTLQPSKLAVGDIIKVTRCHTDSDSENTYTPQKNRALTIAPSAAPELSRLTKNINEVNAYCPQEITQSSELALQLAKKGYDVETLETYAFAYVAQKFNMPFTALLGITNEVGPNGHAEWKENEASTVLKLNDFIKKMLC
jgi:nucleoside phosphorylase